MTSHGVSGDFPVGALVVVESRTWAGINKPGGSGKVIKSFIDAEGVARVDVKYAVSKGTEKNIELEFVKRQEFLGRRSRSRKRDTPFIQEQSEITAKRPPPKRERKVTNKAHNDPRSTKKKINKTIGTTVELNQKDPKIHDPTKQGKNIKDDPRGDEKFDASIPREITIISCCTSTGSLSFQENLLNTREFDNETKRTASRGRKTKRYLEEQARSNRKMTEFFASSTTEALKDTMKSKEFSIHKDVTTTPNSTQQQREEDNSCGHGGNNRTPKISTFNSTVNFGSQNITCKTMSTKNKTKVTTSKRPLLPHDVNISHASDNENQKRSIVSTPLVTPAKKKLVDCQINKNTVDCYGYPAAAHASKQEVETTAGGDVSVKEERMKIFTTLFSQLYRDEIDGEIKLHDVISEVNKQVIVNAKFDYNETVALVKQLDKNGKVMFNTDDEVIYII